MKFVNKYDRIYRRSKKGFREFFTENGDPIMPTREYKIIEGIKTLVITGESDRQSEIDSFAESTDINVIINRFLNGDTSVINPNSGVYGDFRNVPNTYAEIFDRVQMCENIFNSLPVEIKEKFDNSYQKYWSEFGTDHFYDIHNDYNKSISPQPETVEREVVDNAE